MLLHQRKLPDHPHYALYFTAHSKKDSEKAITICQQWIKWYEDRGAIIEKKTVERELEELLLNH